MKVAARNVILAGEAAGVLGGIRVDACALVIRFAVFAVAGTVAGAGKGAVGAVATKGAAAGC